MTEVHDDGNRKEAGRRRSKNNGNSFGGVLLGLGIGWIALKYIDVSFDIFSYLLILAGTGIIASSVIFKQKDNIVGELAGGLIGGLVLAVIFSSIFGGTFIVPFGNSITGSGDLVTQTYDYEDFNAIDVSTGFSLEVTPGDEYSITVTIDDNALDRLEVSKSGDTLQIGLELGGYSNMNAIAKVTMPALNKLELSSGSHGDVSGFTSTNDFDLDLSGGSWVTIVGTAGDLTTDVSSGSHIDLSGFTVNDVDIEFSSGSHGSVYVGGTLDADINGGSHLTYYGNPNLGRIETQTGSTITPK
ncbi:MAG: head GIN domain-containing protein [Candidatus Bathyarchaeia archaeon]